MTDKRLAILTSLLWFAVGNAQERQEIHCTISYVAASTAYVDGGRDLHIAVGDTLTISRSGIDIGTALVTAVSRRSAAAAIIAQQFPFAIGDQARTTKRIEFVGLVSVPPNGVDSTQSPAQSTSPVPESASLPAENVLSGRASLQFNTIIAEDARFNLHQPAVALRLDVRNLFGSGMTLALNSRTSLNASNNYTMYGSHSDVESRAYELSVQQNDPSAAIGYGLGRLSSRYVGGMGTFDGFQFYYRVGTITAGVLGGAQVIDRTLSLNQDGSKGALFLNYHQGADIFHQYDGTVAFGRQMVDGKLDREFLYVQNTLSLGSDLSFYENSEMELQDISNGVRASAFKLSNTFVSMNYAPVDWLSTTFGYDAARNVYLFESMKWIPDTLIDRNLQQSLRASAMVHFSSWMTVSGFGSYSTRQGGFRDAHSFGASIRANDLASIGINAGLRYSNIVGPYVNGGDYSLDVDRTFFRDLTVALKGKYNRNFIEVLHHTYTTLTFSGDVWYRLTPMWFTSVSADYIDDPTMGSFRVYAEIGFRF